MDTELDGRLELLDRLTRLAAEETSYWGWAFLLWGAGQIAALFWTAAAHNPRIAWPTAMSICAAITVLGANRTRDRDRKLTPVSRAILAVWSAAGIGLFVLCTTGGRSGAFHPRAFALAILAIHGLANFASAIILRWRLQLAVAATWWLAAVAVAMTAPAATFWIVVTAILLGDGVWGAYLIELERRRRRVA
ncbi:MAG TPA: hypothetical protein VL284_20775 [Thermoanaerobaculia bacterium]|nr:hypothetical protein [Thermoanaerobaculia bacterium]